MGRQNQLHSTSGVTTSLGQQASFDLGNAAAQTQHHHGQGLLFSGGVAGSGQHHMQGLTSPPKLNANSNTLNASQVNSMLPHKAAS